MSGRQTRAAASRQSASGHERRVSEDRGRRGPTKAEAARQAAAARAAAAPLPAGTLALSWVAAALFLASCVYWLVVFLLPPPPPHKA